MTSSVTNLRISRNPRLTNIDALANIKSIDEYLTIQYNEILSSCSINSVCTHLSGNGDSIISDNDRNISNCNSANEILDNCSNLLIDSKESGYFSIFPNPTNGILNFKSQFLGSYIIKVSDISGKTIIEKTLEKDTKLDLSSLTNGLYFISVQDDLKHYSTKIVKQ